MERLILLISIVIRLLILYQNQIKVSVMLLIKVSKLQRVILLVFLILMTI